MYSNIWTDKCVPDLMNNPVERLELFLTVQENFISNMTRKSWFYKQFLRVFRSASSHPNHVTQVSCPELIGSLKLGNVWVFVHLIFGHRWPMNQLNKNRNIAYLETSCQLWVTWLIHSLPRGCASSRGRRGRTSCCRSWCPSRWASRTSRSGPPARCTQSRGRPPRWTCRRQSTWVGMVANLINSGQIFWFESSKVWV